MKSAIRIEIDSSAGFCYGVKKAIERAEYELDLGELQSLGEIVHNQEEQNRLEEKGLKTITYSDFTKLKGKKVLLRAHGEPPSTYKLAEENGISLMDASCPIVLSIQKKVRKAWEEMKAIGGQVVIYGKEGHPETIGLKGQTDNNAMVVLDPDDLIKLDFKRPIWLFAQTTMNPVMYKTIAEAIKEHYRNQNAESETLLKITDSLCRHVSNREDQLRNFARNFDVILFVSGKNSSNGKLLYSYCQQENARSYLISNFTEISKNWLENCSSIGISGATSTPGWLMQEVKLKLEKNIIF